MLSEDSQQFTVLREDFYDDPEQLSQLLRQRAGSGVSFQFTASPELPSITAPWPAPARNTLSSLPAPHPPRDSSIRRAAAGQRYVRPAQPKHYTAPTLARVMVRGEAKKMYKSFGDAMENLGDTQPDSQMYKHWPSGIFTKSTHGAPVPTSLLQDVEVAEANTPSDQSDGVELVRSSQEEHSPTITSPTVVQEDGPEYQPHSEPPLTSPLKFETPAMAGKKRDHQGHILSSAMRTATTPGTTLTAAFGAGFGGPIGYAMSLTQAFQATPAATSPAINAPSEDLVFQRPSPNFTNVRPSSPVPVFSSPIKAGRSDPRSSSEPRAEYVTMKESQEQRRRERQIQVEEEETSAPAEDSWDMLDDLEKQAARKRAKEAFERETSKSFAKVTAPARTPLRPGRVGGLLAVSLDTPRSKTTSTPAYHRWRTFDGTSAHDGDDLEDELAQAHSPKAGSEDESEDESPDELSQDIRPSPWKVRNTPANSRPAKYTETKVQVPNTSSHPQRTFSGRSARTFRSESPSTQLQRKSQARLSNSQPQHSRDTRSKELVTIMDSQPDIAADPASVQRPMSLLPSSPSQNMYSISQTTMLKKTGYTSQSVSSSMPPLPPRSSSQVLGAAPDEGRTLIGEERVPSSPPAIRHEDDFVYDEHSGEEEEHEVVQVGEVGVDADDESAAEDDRQVSRATVIVEDTNANMDAERDAEDQSAEPDQVALHSEEDELARSSHPHDEMSITEEHTTLESAERPSVVPESDLLEETQPSRFERTDASGNNNHATESTGPLVPDQSNSTSVFHTAREGQSLSQPKDNSGRVVEDVEHSVAGPIPPLRSLRDIAEQPGTQQSMSMEEIEIPRLSSADDAGGGADDPYSEFSPVRPAAKKRKIVYTAKHHTSPLKKVNTTANKAVSSPRRDEMDAPKSTPLSAKAREKQGAMAAAKAREVAVFTAKAPVFRSDLPQRASAPESKKKSGLKKVNKALFGAKPTSPKARSTPATTPRKPRPVKAARASPDEDVRMEDVVAIDGEVDELAGDIAQPIIASGKAEVLGPRLVPNRVFASWPGGASACFYPATCIGCDKGLLRVRYDDDNRFSLDPTHVRAFDLQLGDHVKVDEPGMKRHIYIVAGFGNKIDVNDAEDYPLTDRLGYSTVLLELKSRDSLPAPESERSRDPIAVPMAHIYLTTQLWKNYSDRSFVYQGSPAEESRSGTPTTGSVAGSSKLKHNTTRTASVASLGRTGEMFANMAFALTFKEDDFDKDAIVRVITTNGGEVFDEGFHELFEGIEPLAEGVLSPSKKSKTKTVAAPASDELSLSLKPEYKNTGFVALITDEHSRRAKYFQALALNVPCLHHRWVSDSIAAGTPLPFGKYLLPAGVSSYFSTAGVVRSRTMKLYDPNEEVTFDTVLQDRDLLLKNQSVLLVKGKSKKETERKSTYLFLTHALGASTVGQCNDLAAAKDAVHNKSWDWVYVDGGPTGVIEAEEVLFGNVVGTNRSKTVPKPKKRKRDERVDVEPVAWMRSGQVGGRTVRVACDEFVIQSLILGALVVE